MTGNGGERKLFTGWTTGLGSAAVVTIGAVAYSPGLMYADQSGELNRGYRVALYCLVVASALILIAFALRMISRLGLAPLLAGVSVFWLLNTQANALTSRLGVTPVVVFLIALGAGAIVARLWAMGSVRQGVFLVGAVTALTPVLTLLINLGGREPVIFDGDYSAVPATAGVVSNPPDLWFVILDGYPSDHARTNIHGLAASPLAREFSGEGNFINANALSPYPFTRLAIPAILQGSPPVGDGVVLGSEAGPALRSLLSGDNRLMRTLSQLGYETTIVENGWHMAGCADYIDNCQPPPILDEQLETVIRPSLLDEVLGIHHEDSNLAGVRHLRGWIADNLANLNENETADAVFLHFISPHPPFLLRPDCTEMSRSELKVGDAEPYYWGEGMQDLRLELYEGQLACVDSIVMDLMNSINESSIVAVAGDHGSASMHQLIEADGRNWEIESIRERLLTLAAVRLPIHCDADLATTMGVSTAILACLTGKSLIPPEPAAFIVRRQPERDTVLSLAPEVIDALLDQKAISAGQQEAG